MKTGVTSTRHLASMSFRLDPSLHLSEGLKVREELAKSPYGLLTIKDVSDRVFLGNIFSRIFVKDKNHGKTYLAASDTVLANIETDRYLANSQANKLKHLWLEKDWILVTCSGTLGNVTYTNSTFADKIATHDLIRIVPNDKHILKGVVYAFLACKYGYYQITQSKFGGVVKHINDKEVSKIVIPVFPDRLQNEVDDLIKESTHLREKAFEALSMAKKIVIDYCEKPFYKKCNNNIGVVSSMQIMSTLNSRFDAPVYINNGVSWVKGLGRATVSLGSCKIKTWYPGMFKRIYVEDGYPYIKGSELFLWDPFKKCDKLSRTKTPMLDQLWLKHGQLLLSCAGVCGLVKLITNEYDEKKAVGSPDIIRITSEDPLFTKEYLFVYLQIPAVYDYMQSLKYGSVIERFDIGNIETIPVVIPTIEISNTVTEIIGKYADYFYRAYKCEERAISMIEREIDNWE